MIPQAVVAQFHRSTPAIRKSRAHQHPFMIESQPTEAELNTMPAEKKNEIELRRKWALVYYIRSLIKKPNVVQWLFTEDMELTR